jgi:hypothetical protein
VQKISRFASKTRYWCVSVPWLALSNAAIRFGEGTDCYTLHLIDTALL